MTDSFLRKMGGLFLVVIGITANPWALTFLIRPTDGQVSVESKLIIFTSEFLCFLVAAFMTRKNRFMRIGAISPKKAMRSWRTESMKYWKGFI